MAQLDDDGGAYPARGCGWVKTVTCSCGYVASGETAAELLAAVEAHIDAAHSPAAAAARPAPEAHDVPKSTTEATQ